MDKILETLQIQPLSEEEKTSRHILGRLYGPIATSLESTRNGRKYNHELWEKALNDELFAEKIANRSLFLELGHPTDREETDMEKVCACIPEMPKIVDGDLYAYVDILDTNNGRVLKTLCDYGFVPGISSRGSGDIMTNDEVDPETFFLETWDIVQLPAVKKARLAVCESLDSETLKLKKVLTESLAAASDKDKEVMKEALDNLNIKLNEEKEISEEDIPWSESENNEPTDEEEIEVETEVEETPVEDESSEATTEPEPIPAEEVVEKVEEVAEEIKEVVDASEEQAEAIDEVVEEKVKELLPEEDEQPEVEETEGEDKTESDVEEGGEVEEPTEEAEDSGLEEWISNLKEMIRQKDLLESEIKTLKDEKAVSDAEVKNLKEELIQTKKVSDTELSEFITQVESFSEQLTRKENEIKSLQEKLVSNATLTESVNANDAKVKTLTEKLNAMQKDLEEKENKLSAQKAQYTTKLTETIDIAKHYQAKYKAVVEHYVEQKASMLGVRKADITSRLNEKYSIKDVDAVCEELLERPTHFSNSLIEDFNKGAKLKVHNTEEQNAASKKQAEDLDDLLEFAGLK